MDSKYQSKQIIIEENIKIPPLNETELIKQRNKIVDDYINDMDHRNNNSKEKNIKDNKEGIEEDDDIFLIAERNQRQRKEKVKSNRENRLRFPNCHFDQSSYRSAKGQFFTSEEAVLKNSSFDNNDKWHYVNNNKYEPSHLYYKEDVSKKNMKDVWDNSNNGNSDSNNNQKRNKTAKNINKLNLFDHNSSAYITKANNRIKSFKPEKEFESKKKKTVYEGNGYKNPYSIDWANKMLDKRYNMEFELCLNSYSHGIPGIQLNTKKDQFNNVSFILNIIFLFIIDV